MDIINQSVQIVPMEAEGPCGETCICEAPCNFCFVNLCDPICFIICWCPVIDGGGPKG